jgi:hypothetical protein
VICGDEVETNSHRVSGIVTVFRGEVEEEEEEEEEEAG